MESCITLSSTTLCPGLAADAWHLATFHPPLFLPYVTHCHNIVNPLPLGTWRRYGRPHSAVVSFFRVSSHRLLLVQQRRHHPLCFLWRCTKYFTFIKSNTCILSVFGLLLVLHGRGHVNSCLMYDDGLAYVLADYFIEYCCVIGQLLPYWWHFCALMYMRSALKYLVLLL